MNSSPAAEWPVRDLARIGQSLLANDNDDDKAWCYARNFGRAGLVVADIADLTTADLPGRADLAHGLAALRRGELWPAGARAWATKRGTS